jgi:hypothetical protein
MEIPFPKSPVPMPGFGCFQQILVLKPNRLSLKVNTAFQPKGGQSL